MRKILSSVQTVKSFKKLIVFLWDDIYIYLIQNETKWNKNYPWEIKIGCHSLAGRLMMASQSYRNSPHLWICYIIQQWVIKNDDWIKFAKIGRLFWIIQVEPEGSWNVQERSRRVTHSGNAMWERLKQPLLALKMEEGQQWKNAGSL